MDPLLAEVDRLVAEEAKRLHVWTAVRVTEDGHVAFMGTFTTRKAAKARCQNNTTVKLKWTARGHLDMGHDQWHTQIVPFGPEKTIRYSIAEQEIT